MKRLTNILSFLCLAVVLINCSDDEPNTSVDNVQEFVFLTETTFSANESGNSTDETAIEIQAEMLAFAPKSEDLILTLEIEENGAVAGVDYEVVSSTNQIIIPSGSLTSTTGFKIKTIDNDLQASGDRSITVTITAVSDESINIGLGINEVTSDQATITIADDECPDTIDKFEGAVWLYSGTATNENYTPEGNYTTSINGTDLTLTGNLFGFGPDITVQATLVPDGAGATTGTIDFGSTSEEDFSDGYTYRWILNSGTYDVCAEVMTLSSTIQYIDIYGPDPTAWVDWYDSETTATIDSFLGGGGGGSCETSNLTGVTAMATSFFSNYNDEYPSDDNTQMYDNLSFSVNDDCSQLTVTGDFLALGQYFPIEVVFTLSADPNDPNIGTVSVPTQFIGNDGYGFDYRVRSTGVPGSYNLSDGTLDIDMFVDYDNAGAGYINWYTASVSFDYASTDPGGGGCALQSFNGKLTDVTSSFTAFNSEYYYADYDNSYTDLGLAVNEDCSVITVSGDFLDLGGLLDTIEIDFTVLPNQVLAIATQVIGTDGGGFEYRVRSTGSNGTYDLDAGTISIELFVDYDNNGAGYVNWYTSTSSFTVK